MASVPIVEKPLKKENKKEERAVFFFFFGGGEGGLACGHNCERERESNTILTSQVFGVHLILKKEQIPIQVLSNN